MNYLNRRRRLLEKVAEGTILLFSGYEVLRSADESYPFSVNRNFYYLTGISQRETYCVLNRNQESLYILENDDQLAKWVGYNLFPKEAKKISQFNDVETYGNIELVLKDIALSNKVVYLDLERSSFLGGINQGERLKSLLLSFNPNLEIRDIYNEIVLLRSVKDSDEIEALRHSIHITKLALDEVISNLPNMVNEKEVQSLFEQKISSFGFAETSFSTIAASGKNATILHYSTNRDTFNKEDMILLDLGARCNFYNADISRTYPHFGKYSKLQRDIYNVVLNCNKEIIKSVKVGITIKELQLKTKELLANGLIELGVIKEFDEINEYYFHNVSHHLGLDTHDPMSREVPLVEGNVITVEPGLYIPHLNIGIRIEDDVLVTSNGAENLSQEIIKEIEDIELFMQEKN